MEKKEEGMPRALIVALIVSVGVLSGSFSPAAGENESEELTITTYYPAPYGVYNDLEAKDACAVGDMADSFSPELDAVGALSEGELWVQDSLIYNPQPGDPTNFNDPNWAAGKIGEVRYSSSKDDFYYYNGERWVLQSGGSYCFIKYNNSTSSAVVCPVGWTAHPLGVWGWCVSGGFYEGMFYAPSVVQFPPGGKCPGSGGGAWWWFWGTEWDTHTSGNAAMCCKE
jgi:hypothetical protein